jgi:hypothetical protein
VNRTPKATAIIDSSVNQISTRPRMGNLPRRGAPATTSSGTSAINRAALQMSVVATNASRRSVIRTWDPSSKMRSLRQPAHESSGPAAAMPMSIPSPSNIGEPVTMSPKRRPRLSGRVVPAGSTP